MPEAETREKLYEFFDSISYLDADKNYRIYYRCGIVPMRTTIEMGDRVADAGKQAKAFGTKPYKTELIFFTDEMNDKQNRAIQLRSYLDTAIARDEFMVYLQPKYDIKTEKIKGAEALIRWKYMGQNIRNCRMKKKWTQKQLAIAVDVDRADISRYENGTKGAMNFKKLNIFFKALM